MREQWREAVDDLDPPPSTMQRCNIRSIPGIECDSDRELINHLMNKPRGNDHLPKVNTQAFEQRTQEHIPA